MEEIRQFLDQVIAHSSPEAPIWNQEARLANHPIRWSYIDGCMILAIQYMFNATQDENYLAFVETFIDHYIDEAGNPLGYDEKNITVTQSMKENYCFSYMQSLRKANTARL